MTHLKKTKLPAFDYQCYIYDVIEQLKESYEEAIAEYEEGNFKNEYERGLSDGIKSGHHFVLQRLRNQAECFEIPLEEIGLEDEIPLM